MNSVVERVIQEIPLWARLFGALWVPVCAFVVSWAATRLGVELASIKARRLGPEAHWTERARLWWPARRKMALGMFLGMFLSGAWANAFVGPYAATPRAVLIILGAMGGMLGAMVTGRWVSQLLAGRKVSVRYYLKIVAADMVLRTPHILVLGAMLACLSVPMEPWRWGVIALGSVASIFFGVVGGLPLMKLLGWSRPAPPEVMSIVSEVGQRVGVQPRNVWIVDWQTANALAYPLSQDIALTAELLKVVNDDELGAIVAHEMGHLSEPLMVRLLRLTPAIFLCLLVVTIPLSLEFGIVPMIAALVVVFVLIIVLGRVRRKMEERADKVGHEHQGEEGTYARALEKLYRHNIVPVVMAHQRGAHPDLYDRLLSSGVEPDYPKPEPPPRHRISSVVMTLVFGIGLGVCAFAPQLIWNASPHDGDPANLANARTLLGVTGGDFNSLLTVTTGTEDPQTALLYSQALAEFDSDNPTTHERAAWLEASAGMCDAAKDRLMFIEVLLEEKPGRFEVDVETLRAVVDVCDPDATLPE